MKQQEEKKIDGAAILREVAGRWRLSQTLEYQSLAILNHRAEYRIEARMHVFLQRPNLARIVIKADLPEFSRLRVCDGRSIWDRTISVPLRPAATTRLPYIDHVTGNIPHPLDETSYSADQFFSRAPFMTPPIGHRGTPTVAGVALANDQGFRLTIQWDDVTVDTLTIESISLRPLALKRVADHGGIVQEILNENFELVSLGARIPAETFRWNPRDESGAPLR